MKRAVCWPEDGAPLKVTEQHFLQETKAGVLLEAAHKDKMRTRWIQKVHCLNRYLNASHSTSLPVPLQNLSGPHNILKSWLHSWLRAVTGDARR